MDFVVCKHCGNKVTVLDLGLELECEGCRNAQDRVEFEMHWNNRSSFMGTLCEAIVKSDSTNSNKLYKSFPNLVNGYSMYAFGRPWEMVYNDIHSKAV